MKVYLVYRFFPYSSDIHDVLMHIFSSKEKAEDYIKNMPSNHHYEIEEWTII